MTPRTTSSRRSGLSFPPAPPQPPLLTAGILARPSTECLIPPHSEYSHEFSKMVTFLEVEVSVE